MMRCLGLAALLGIAALSTTQRARYEEDVTVSARSSTNSWHAYIGAPGRREYEFLLDPERDVRGVLIGWDLKLRRPGHHENLLEPAGNWHGLQPFNFVARDFTAGPDHSVFGRVRRIPVRGVKRSVVVRVLTADVASIDEEFVSLSLHVELRDDAG